MVANRAVALTNKYGVVVSVGAIVGLNAIFSLIWKTAVVQPATDRLGLEKSKDSSDGTRQSRGDLSALWRLLRVSVGKKQGMYIALHTFLLFLRSWLTIRMAVTIGETGSVVVQRQMKAFVLAFRKFALIAVANTLLNAGLRKIDHVVVDSIRTRLTSRIQHSYLKKRRYFHLAMQPQPFVADQRIVRDVEEWAHKVVHLYSHTFKPLLDVILSGKQLFKVLGPASPILMYAYFAFAATAVGFKAPPFSQCVAEEQRREGEFYQLHSRLVAHSEEIAFMRGEKKELSLLENALTRSSKFKKAVSLASFRQNILDNWVVKYSATMVSIAVSSIPLMLRTDLTAVELVAQQRTCDGLMRTSATATADVILIYKKVLMLLGFTGRIEDVILGLATTEDQNAPTRKAGQLRKTPRDGPANASFYGCSLTMEDARSDTPVSFDWSSYHIRFQDVSVQAPDGRLLIKSLNLYVQKGDHMLVSGPNGSGKTSLFRVVAGLWELSRGHLYTSMGCITYYLPQRPYMVYGNLRDQVWYPKEAEKTVDYDMQVSRLLADVGLTFLQDLDRHEDWNTLLSGGEKQKLAFARLLFHHPQFAVLDEATAALSTDAQEHLYQLLQASDITFFSIAHRVEVRKFHVHELHLTGDGDGSWQLREIRKHVVGRGTKYAKVRRTSDPHKGMQCQMSLVDSRECSPTADSRKFNPSASQWTLGSHDEPQSPRSPTAASWYS